MTNVSARELCVGYSTRGGEVEAVKSVSFDIEDGEYWVLLGPSGCGKSSTLRAVAGLERATSGDILFDGESVRDLPPSERNVAMAFENYALYPPLTVRENLEFPLRARGMPDHEVRASVERVASMLDLEEILGRKPRELSGGQKQRVSLGRAIIRRPRLFILDEPLSHVDTSQRVRMRTSLRALQRELGVTTMHVTHDQGEAIAMADRLAVMDAGRIRQIGTPREVFHQPASVFVADFVGEPPINLIQGRFEALADGAAGFVSSGDGTTWRLPGRPHVPASLWGREVVLGVRPHRISLDPGSDGDLHGKALLWEWLGEEGQAAVDVDGMILQVVTERDLQLAHGDLVSLRFAPEDMLVFEAESQQRLDVDFTGA